MKSTIKRSTVVLAVVLALVFSLCGCQSAAYNESSISCKTTSAVLLSSENNTGTEITEEESEDVNLLRTRYDWGVCRKLEGNIGVVLFYMDDSENEWDSSEIKQYTKYDIQPGLDFLEKEAERYGVDLHFTIKQTYTSSYKGEVITDISNSDYVYIDTFRQAARNLKYTSDYDLYASFLRDYDIDEVICLFIFNENGTSYTLSPTRTFNINIVEHCILFAYDLYSDRDELIDAQASVTAHEILHLYGAEDFYNIPGRAALAEEQYPQDIMLYARYHIRENEISEATAFYVGWTDEVPDVLYNDEWYEQTDESDESEQAAMLCPRLRQ